MDLCEEPIVFISKVNQINESKYILVPAQVVKFSGLQKDDHVKVTFKIIKNEK